MNTVRDLAIQTPSSDIIFLAAQRTPKPKEFFRRCTDFLFHLRDLKEKHSIPGQEKCIVGFHPGDLPQKPYQFVFCSAHDGKLFVENIIHYSLDEIAQTYVSDLFLKECIVSETVVVFQSMCKPPN